MNILIYGIIFLVLLALELVYFRVADRFNIIDKPNERSSHSSIVLRGGGIIFLLGVLVWALAGLFGCFGDGTPVYPWFLLAVLLAAGISFVDDIRSLPDSVRLVVQFVAMGLLIFQLYVSARGEGLFGDSNLLVNSVFVLAALVVCVGATNVYNFMDGINGITAGYSLAVLVPLALVNGGVGIPGQAGNDVAGVCAGDGSVGLLSGDVAAGGFMAPSFIAVAIISVLVFAFFNFRPRGKAKCFAGDVGSIGIAFILLFAIGKLIVRTEDITWLVFLLVYGVDGCLTICHRILLHENLGQAHRKHAYQLMANELKMSHPVVSLIYMGLQLAVSLGFIYLCPVLASASGLTLVTWHWIYLGVSLVVLAVAYVLFKKKYYHLHEEYLASLNK